VDLNLLTPDVLLIDLYFDFLRLLVSLVGSPYALRPPLVDPPRRRGGVLMPIKGETKDIGVLVRRSFGVFESLCRLELDLGSFSFNFFGIIKCQFSKRFGCVCSWLVTQVTPLRSGGMAILILLVFILVVFDLQKAFIC
jgi:hypothetical protein